MGADDVVEWRCDFVWRFVDIGYVDFVVTVGRTFDMEAFVFDLLIIGSRYYAERYFLVASEDKCIEASNAVQVLADCSCCSGIEMLTLPVQRAGP